jgi:hypothetical protein
VTGSRADVHTSRAAVTLAAAAALLGGCGAGDAAESVAVTQQPIAFDQATDPGWVRWGFERHYRPVPGQDEPDLEQWVRRRTPKDAQISGWIRVDDRGIAELYSQTVDDDDGRVWMQSRLVRDQQSLVRDWTRCSQAELQADLPGSVTDLVEEDFGSVTPPTAAQHSGDTRIWDEPQGVITLRVHQRGTSALDRRVEAVSNTSRTVLFEMSAFRLERVPGPPPDFWASDETFRRVCRPLTPGPSGNSTAELTG